MVYKHIKPREVIKIDTVVNASKTIFDKNDIFEGESHNFWEFQYTAKGAPYIHSNGDFYTLRQGEITFFKPNEFHVVYGDGKSACEMWVFSFACASPLLDKCAHTILQGSEECIRLMQSVLREAQSTFTIVPHPPDGRILHRKPGTAIGSEQLIAGRLEELLILLLRCKENVSTTARTAEALRLSQQETLPESVHAYLTAHVNTPLCLTQLAAAFGVSVSRIKTAYRQAYGCSPIADFHQMKAARAKELLAQQGLSIGEVAAALSFENVYYFSNFFKRKAGMSPSAYRRFVRSAQK